MKWRRSTAQGTRTREPLGFSDWLVIAAAALVLILLAGYGLLDAWAQHRLDSEVAKIRAAGDPVTLDDIQFGGDTLGAGVEYAAAFEQMRKIHPVEVAKWEQREDEQMQMLSDFEERHQPLQVITPEIEAELIQITQTISEAGGFDIRFLPDQHLVSEWEDSAYDLGALSERGIADAQEMLQAYAQPLERLRHAAGIDPFSFPRPIGRAEEDMYLSLLDDAVSLLTVSALLHLNAERFEAAAEDVYVLLRLRRVSFERAKIGDNAADRVITAVAARLIAVILPKLPANSPSLPKFEAEMETASGSAKLTELLILERAKSFTYLQWARENDRSGVAYWEFMPDPMVRMQMADFLVYADRAIVASRGPLSDMVRSMEPDAENTMWQLARWPPLAKDEACAVAIVTAARAAIAVERYRRDHQRVPQSLEELTPTYLDTPPIDPFTGRTMLLRSSDDVYVIYSVGRDGMNDYGAVTGKRPRVWYTPDDGVRVRID